MGEKKFTQEAAFLNSAGKTIKVILEPWGDEYLLDQNRTVKLILRRQASARLSR
jgi:hypothetical protein